MVDVPQPSREVTTVGLSDFNLLGQSLERFNALLHAFDNAQLLDHVQAATEPQRKDMAAAHTIIDLILHEGLRAAALYREASQ